MKKYNLEKAYIIKKYLKLSDDDMNLLITTGTERGFDHSYELALEAKKLKNLEAMKRDNTI